MGLRVVADENMPAVEALLGNQVDVLRVPGRAISAGHLIDADALLVRSVTPVDARLLEGGSVRFVGTATAGVEHIDREWLRAAGIGFAHAPGANANSVAEYVLCAIAAVDDYLEQLLGGARVGIVGCGHVGKALAARLAALGIEYLAYDPWLTQQDLPGGQACGWEDILQCEVICLHPELTRRKPWPSFHLLAQQALQQLNGEQLLVNASRGAVIDTTALLNRLRAPAAPQLVLDVWEGEPNINAELLRQARLGTAHIAGYSLDGKVLATQRLCTALADCLSPSLALQATDPLPPLAPLTLSKVAGPADALRQLLDATYCIAQDDQRLRAAVLSQPPAVAARNFDSLRKHYADRRELAGRTVVLPAAAQAYRSLVEALGCVVANGEAQALQ